MSAEERKANLAEVKEMETEIRYHMKKREIEKTYLVEYEDYMDKWPKKELGSKDGYEPPETNEVDGVDSMMPPFGSEFGQDHHFQAIGSGDLLRVVTPGGSTSHSRVGSPTVGGADASIYATHESRNDDDIGGIMASVAPSNIEGGDMDMPSNIEGAGMDMLDLGEIGDGGFFDVLEGDGIEGLDFLGNSGTAASNDGASLDPTSLEALEKKRVSLQRDLQEAQMMSKIDDVWKEEESKRKAKLEEIEELIRETKST